MTILLKYWEPLAVALLVALLVAVIYGAGWIEGAGHVNAKWEAEKKDAALAAAEQDKNHAHATVQVVTEYVDKIKVVHDKGATIIKEVPVYVPNNADADCNIHMGFVRLHDAAAANTLPGPTGDTDAAPAGVALSAVAATVAENYGVCHEYVEQIVGLQDWIKAMGKPNG